jgi:hypothetical protein
VPFRGPAVEGDGRARLARGRRVVARLAAVLTRGGGAGQEKWVLGRGSGVPSRLMSTFSL